MRINMPRYMSCPILQSLDWPKTPLMTCRVDPRFYCISRSTQGVSHCNFTSPNLQALVHVVSKYSNMEAMFCIVFWTLTCSS